MTGKAAAICLLLAFCNAARGQEQSSAQANRLTIGLALEGGGALGLAHIGLLEWLEQHQIPVDYIAGTSMGGLVAGFYASGMSGSDKHTLVDNLDWNKLVGGKTDAAKLSLQRKQDFRELGNSSQLGLRHKLVLPTGLNSGQVLDLLVSRIALPYGQLSSFNQLPTPFRCVAADLATAKAFVFEQGSLAEAMRSTMAIPALFEPVFDGKHEFVDGGFLNNLPVDLVKGMGADVTIAVYLATDPFDPAKPQSALDVLKRTVSVVTLANERRNIETADLLISVDLKRTGNGTLTFNDYPEIIQRGFDGAEKRKRVLMPFALGDEDWVKYLKNRAAKRKQNLSCPNSSK